MPACHAMILKANMRAIVVNTGSLANLGILRKFSRLANMISENILLLKFKEVKHTTTWLIFTPSESLLGSCMS